jgi:capsular exopolysaccharide synthesis family protein
VYEPRQRKEARRQPEERIGKYVSASLVTLLDPNSAAAGAYHVLGSNLHYSLTDMPSKIIVLTSPGPGEGKSAVCANLGVVLAEAENSVLIVDCDLRKPAVHGVFGLRNLHGLENVLSGDRNPDEVRQEMIPGLRIVTSGPIPPYPAELLASRRFKEFLRQASKEFDYVLLNSPPMSVIPDSLVLTAQGDGVLVVLDARKTRKEALRRAVRSLEGVHANVLGTVMGNVEVDQ